MLYKKWFHEFPNPKVIPNPHFIVLSGVVIIKYYAMSFIVPSYDPLSESLKLRTQSITMKKEKGLRNKFTDAKETVLLSSKRNNFQHLNK